ncbi:MAG: P1 family peptidase [Nitratireductor sp.]
MQVIKPGKHNLITDIIGISVGNAHDEDLKSGTTVLLTKSPSICSYHISGGAPGTKETDLLKVENTVQEVNAITLSGGSSFGLDAASGVQAFLREKKIGFEIGDQVVPIVPAAIIFDLINGGNKDWGKYAPYRDLGFDAAQQAAKNKNQKFEIGSQGAGFGALTANLKGGLGSASCVLSNGTTIGALVVVNALGSANIANGANFWASPFELENEFGGLGFPKTMPKDANKVVTKFQNRNTPQSAGTNTTIAIIATDATLTKAEAKRLSMSAHDGFARALWPVHTPMDGDLVFGLSTCDKPAPKDTNEWIELCAHASSTMSRAIARAVYEAKEYKDDAAPTWQSVHGKA